MKKVLVLEDEASIRRFIVINLRRAGYDGAATIELVSMYTDDPTYYAKCAIERVRELL